MLKSSENTVGKVVVGCCLCFESIGFRTMLRNEVFRKLVGGHIHFRAVSTIPPIIILIIWESPTSGLDSHHVSSACGCSKWLIGQLVLKTVP
jgi:hypothetical protein